MIEKGFSPEQRLKDGARIQRFKDVEEFLYSVLPSSPKVLFKEGEGFNRSKYFMREIGDPQEQYRSIHIAGTSGKGSTSYYLSGILISHGFDVGTHVSPHVFDLRERSMINLNLPEENEFLASVNSLLPAIRHMDDRDSGRPTFFEVTVGNAFSIFARRNVDYAVIETGLGGQYDSTNTIGRTDKLAVIGKIGLDHIEVLGDTLPKIARQKAGIMPYRGMAIVLGQTQEVTDVFGRTAKERGDKLEVIPALKYAKNIRQGLDGITFDYDDGEITIDDCVLPTVAIYQVENACLAIATAKHLSYRDGFTLDSETVRHGLRQTTVPGRCEVRQFGGKKIILDGAHNLQNIQALCDTVATLGLDKKPVWLVGFKKDKDVRAVTKHIKGFASKIVFTEFFRDQENEVLRGFPTPVEELIKLDSQSIAEEDSRIALQRALLETDDGQVLIISGSIYLLGELEKYLS